MSKHTGFYVNGVPGLRRNISFRYDYTNKERAIANLNRYALLRTMQMFKWQGLPDTIPQRSLEMMLQTNGFCGFAEYEGNIYALDGGLGGEPDANYLPTSLIVANPYLGFNKELKVDVDTVLMPNDSMFCGLLPLFSRYNSLIIENDITMKMVDVNTRATYLLTAKDDKTKVACDVFLKQIEEGKAGVVTDKSFQDDGVETQPYSNIHTGIMTQLIELEQYLKASMWQELGLNGNFNMKREALNSAESQLNEDMLYPLVDDMLQCRQESCEKINAMFDINLSVELNSSWKDNREELEAELENLEQEAPTEPEEVQTDAETE